MSFFESLLKMLIISVMGVINISRQFFSTLVWAGFRLHDFDDELKISFLISSSVTRSKTFIMDLISGVFTLMEYSVLYLEIGFNFINKIFKEMVTK